MRAQPLILRHTYTRNRLTARAGIRYYQMRPRGQDEPPRSLFTGGGVVSRDEAYALLDAHQGRVYLAHRLMLSPPEEARPADLQAFTRHVMGELSEAHGRPLHWVAVEHRNTDHPHVHVVLCGDAGRSGGEVRLFRSDHTRMREDGLTYCLREAQERDGWHTALARAVGATEREDRDADGDTRGRDDHDR